jgi:hypothetical protein
MHFAEERSLAERVDEVTPLTTPISSSERTNPPWHSRSTASPPFDPPTPASQRSVRLRCLASSFRSSSQNLCKARHACRRGAMCKEGSTSPFAPKHLRSVAARETLVPNGHVLLPTWPNDPSRPDPARGSRKLPQVPHQSPPAPRRIAGRRPFRKRSGSEKMKEAAAASASFGRMAQCSAGIRA